MARVPLSQRPGWNVLQEDQDIRGLRLVNEAGHTLGLISDLIIDEEAGFVDAILLDTGEEVAADDIEIGRDIVYLRRSATQPPVPKALVERVDALRIPVVEETLRVGKRQVESGGVRVTTDVEDVPVHEHTMVREETIGLRRVPVHRPVNEGEVDAAFEEGIFEVLAHGEELDIGKQLFVVEEIHIKKAVIERPARIHESVRHTRVDIQELSSPAHALEPEKNDTPLERREGAQ